MLARLSLTLNNPEVNYKQSSNLQGVIMEHIDTNYAEVLHSQGVNPYSQSVQKKDGKTIWHINTLQSEAYEKIILPFLSESFHSFSIKKKDMTVEIEDKSLKTVQKKSLMNEFYEGNGSKYINVEFLTPTAFKSGGKYVFFPDIRLMYSSLMNRYGSVSKGVEMWDEDTLELLTQSSEIAHYRLKSCLFPMEKITVPGFTGTITIKLHGNRVMNNYANLLFSFGEYAGIGIKTSMGMGSIRLYEWGSDKR